MMIKQGTSIVAMLAAALLATPAMAAEARNSISMAARASTDDVTLKMEMRKAPAGSTEEKRRGLGPVAVTSPSSPELADGGKVKTGEDIVICFTASRDGFVTLWSVDAAGEQAVIYPNAFSHADSQTRAAEVKQGKSYCVGQEDMFVLRAQPPLGESKVYLHWTRTAEEQLAKDDSPVIGRSSRSVPADYASETILYTITE